MEVRKETISQGRIVIAIFFLSVSFFIFEKGYSEGTKQAQPYPTSTVCELCLYKTADQYCDVFGHYTADSNHVINVRIKSTSEKLYMGFGSFLTYATWAKCRITHNGTVVWGWEDLRTSPGPGYISTYSQAVAGPNVLNPAGYAPFVFSPPEPGDYTIEFDFNNYRIHLTFFDFTVIDTIINPLQAINGRVWSKNWEFAVNTGPIYGFRAALFVQTYDGLIDTIKYTPTGMCAQFQLNFNHNGCSPPPVMFEESRKSRAGRFNYPEYRVFFNNPDSTIFPSGTTGDIVPGSITLTPNCNGQYFIDYFTTKSGFVQIFLDINPLSGVQPEDIQIRDSVNMGLSTFFWNGLNGLGNPVSSSSTINVIITFMNGLTNHPLYSTTQQDTGFIVGLKRPFYIQPKQFWNDTLLSGGTLQLNGCQSTIINGCHTWIGYQYNCSGSFGGNRTINTWWYSGNPDTLHNAPLTSSVSSPDSIDGGKSICFSAGQRYSYTVFPNPLNGATGYSWRLYLGGTLINTWNTLSVLNDSVSFPGPGIYLLIANGYNSCESGIADTIQIQVEPQQPVSISIASTQNSICQGTPVTFTATPINAGTTPVYQWKVNSINTGFNSPIYTYTPNNGDVVQCILTSSNTVCTSNNPASSNTISMVVYPNLPVSVSVSPSQNPVCAGTSVTFTATPNNGGTTPSYQWKVNGINVGTNNPSYSYTPLNNDVVTCILTSSETCTSGNPASSNIVAMTVNPLLPVSITISPSSNPFCIGNAVTFTATPTNGGTNPSYQWKVNGVNVGTNNPTYTYNPVSGDVVTCTLTSSEPCTSSNPASSNPVSMIGTVGLPAGISITASPNPFCPGSPVNCTATPANGGMNPFYQWKVNGVNVGTNSPNYSFNPLNNDSVRCVMTSNLSCVSNNPAGSNKIILSGTLAPVVTFTSCFDTITTLNAKPIKLKGGIPLNGTYSGPGVNSTTGVFTPSTAGIGLKTITYSYTNVSLCSASKNKTILVQSTPSFTCGNTLTDIRDSKVYPTVQIGSQCWMATNLNHGIIINSPQLQYDNCISEKYCYNNLNSNCSSYGGLYRWDELMQYDDTPSNQGLCPPGWHIPTEGEWTTLFNFYSGSAFAGKPLQDSIIAGFRALTSGVFYMSTSWNFNGFATLFWSSTSWGATKALSHGMNTYNYSVSLYPSSRANAFPARCLKD